jgi:Zn finger protein HypA/HybF involved in hydrogenase expression
MTPKARANRSYKAGIALAGLSAVALVIGHEASSRTATVLGAALVITSVVNAAVSLANRRCPHCSQFIDLRGPSAHCPRCGKWIPEDDRA